MMAEGYSFSGVLLDYYQPSPGSLWNGNGEYFQYRGLLDLD